MRHLKKKLAAARSRRQDGQEGTGIESEEEILKIEYPNVKIESDAKLEQESSGSDEKVQAKNKGAKVIKEGKKKTDEAPKKNGRPKKSQSKNQDNSPEDFKAGSDGKMAKGSTSAKNIIKNYGRALQNFAISNMVLPYLTPLIQRENVTLKDFRKFFYSKKKQVRSIAGLRALLLVQDDDDENSRAYKKIFREISIVFIKFFSVNWIFSGKLLNKIAHLKCRFKMLRRIKDPENFTYLKGFL